MSTLVLTDAVSEVWVAHHAERTTQQSIIRLIDSRAASGPAITACLQEASAASALRHRNIVRVLDVGDGAVPYVLSRYAPAVPLAQSLGSPWSVDDVIEFARPLAAALDAASAGGFAHGAVHPRTIWLDRRAEGSDRRPLLSGFGLHHLLAEVAGSHRHGAPLDDFLYVAPESLRGAAPTGRSDQYALGAAVHHALVGSPPFERRTLSALFGAHLFAHPSVVGLDTDASDALEEILARAMAKDPDARFEDCGAFVSALESWQQLRSGLHAPALPRPTPLPNAVGVTQARQVPARALGFAAGAGVAAVLLVLAVLRVLGPADEVPGTPLAASASETETLDVAQTTEAVATEDSTVRWRADLDVRPTAMHVTPAGLLVEADGRTTVIDTETGELRAAFASDGRGVVAGGTRYVTGGDGILRAIDVADGTVRWQVPVETASPPTAVDDTVYGISTADVPQLIATDADSGKRLWAFPKDEAAFPPDTAVSASDDFVYLADEEAVYGILPVGEVAGEDTPLISATEPASEPLCLWRHEVDEQMWTGALRAVEQGVVVANRSGSVCLRGHVDGERVWCVPVTGVAEAQPTLYESDGQVVVVTRAAITALNARTGEQAWQTPGPWRTTVRDGDRLLAVQPDGRLAMVALSSGDLRRPVDANVGAGALLAVDGDVLYAARRNGTLISVDLTS